MKQDPKEISPSKKKLLIKEEEKEISPSRKKLSIKELDDKKEISNFKTISPSKRYSSPVVISPSKDKSSDLALNAKRISQINNNTTVNEEKTRPISPRKVVFFTNLMKNPKDTCK